MNKYPVIGLPIDAQTEKGAVEALLAARDRGRGGYVCFVNAHSAVESRRSQSIAAAMRGATFAFPDGTPVYLALRLLGHRCEKISGPDLMPGLLSVARQPRTRHFFYGGRPEVLKALVARVRREFPDAEVAGWESPPFRQLSECEVRDALARIRSAQPDFVWVGLGAPKQELWMSEHWESLKPAMLLGVGAAFDFHAGTLNRAPRWMQRAGLEWVHRLSQEPARLWRRYLKTNTLFIAYWLMDLIGIRDDR